jgi:hypothetical protein
MKTAKSNRDEVRENTLCIPMSKAEKEAVQRLANKTGLSMSAWARMVLNEKVNLK